MKKKMSDDEISLGKWTIPNLKIDKIISNQDLMLNITS
jgi:hypothetical protein